MISRKSYIFQKFLIFLILTTTLVEHETKADDEDVEAQVDDEQDQSQPIHPPPPEVIPKTRKLEKLIFRRKPMYEELLAKRQRMILDTADRVFSLKYNSLPVKKKSALDTTSEEEALEIRAFELLSGIVGRALRNAIICSTGKNDSVYYISECSQSGTSVLQDGRSGLDKSPNPRDKLCSPDDPETLTDAGCQYRKSTGRKNLKTNAGRAPALENVLFVHSTALASLRLRVAPNGGLREAIDKGIWNKDYPTKIILSLLPIEFLKQKYTNEQINHQLISALTQKYGTHNPHNIVEIQWPEIWPNRLGIVQLGARFLSTADELSRVILRWKRRKQVDMSKLHIIGFSLGAHMAGVIGQFTMMGFGGAPVGRITGLDPLGWGFDEMDGFGVEADLELTNDDAMFVDVIHTSSPDPHYPFTHFGSNEKRGKVDFYPNNGRAQYCEATNGLCHHFYSVALYAASLMDEGFKACKCESWDDYVTRRRCLPCIESAVMGEFVDKTKASGAYYLVTA